jgi:hypothetical protein
MGKNKDISLLFCRKFMDDANTREQTQDTWNAAIPLLDANTPGNRYYSVYRQLGPVVVLAKPEYL